MRGAIWVQELEENYRTAKEEFDDNGGNDPVKPTKETTKSILKLAEWFNAFERGYYKWTVFASKDGGAYIMLDAPDNPHPKWKMRLQFTVHMDGKVTALFLP
jgi:hypothetical protein